mgnify:CR=1 FL=1
MHKDLEGASSPSSGGPGDLSPSVTELLECFERLELEHGLHGLDLPWDVMSALSRFCFMRLHPTQSAEFTAKAAEVFAEMSQDLAEISHDAKSRSH